MGNYVQAFLTQAEAVLEAHRMLAQTEGFSRLPSGATQFDVSTRMLKLRVDQLTPLIPASKVPLVKMLATQISVRYYKGKGYSVTTADTLIDEVGCSKNTLNTALAIMNSTGLWGKVPGQGHIGTRYYSLLTEDGYNGFLKVVEEAKKGIHPLFGSQKPSNEAEGQEPQNDVSAPAEPAPVPAEPTYASEPAEPATVSEPDALPAEEEDVSDAWEAPSPVLNQSGVAFSELPSGAPLRKEYCESL